jgi:hypothetical protein
MNLYHKLKNKLIYDVDSLRARIQRFKRGYSYGDVWDMDFWFMRNVKPMLIHLRDHGMGIPFDLYLDGEENERAAWEAVLTEMIDCLTLMDEDEAQKYLGIADEDWSVESYNKVNDLMDEKKNRFFELFSKHFYSLWD